jgi:FAD/FMN-containing dehydrogenase
MTPAPAHWSNWSGSVCARPLRIARPHSERALCALVRKARECGRSVRVAGAGHSSSELVATDGIVVDLARFRRVVSTSRSRCRAVVQAGAELQALGKALYRTDLALANYGDVATQRIAGAIGTGTHGTGPQQGNLSTMLVGARLVDGRGQIRVIDATDPDALSAARVALGTLGIFTALELQLVPAFDVQRIEFAAPVDAVLADLDRLVQGNRSMDFYWYPRRDDCKVRLVNPVGGGTGVAGYGRLLELREGYGHELIPTHSGIPHRFEECEYALPRDAGPACFAEVRARMRQRWRAGVAWRVLYRTVAADEAWLSPFFDRESATVSVHQNASLPWREFFDDIEPIFRAHGGRPHWGKKHGLRGPALARLYPRWDDFAGQRQRFDPDGVFLTPYLRELLGVAG